jgi:hypothetical protein
VGAYRPNAGKGWDRVGIAGLCSVRIPNPADGSFAHHHWSRAFPRWLVLAMPLVLGRSAMNRLALVCHVNAACTI